MFQSDIYPPTTGIKPGTTASEWFGGKTALPPKISLESVYEGGAPEEVPSDYKPPAASTSSTFVQSPPPTKSEAPKAEPAPAPITSRGPAPTMNNNKASLADQASKFADKDEEEESSDDETSSFEEVPKPIERPTVTSARQEEKKPEPPKPTPAPAAAPPKESPAPAAQVTSSSTPTPSQAPTAAAGAAAGIKDHLTDIKNALAQQNKIMADQSDQIALLMREVSRLKDKVGSQSSDREKDERIRQLELELEEARS